MIHILKQTYRLETFCGVKADNCKTTTLGTLIRMRKTGSTLWQELCPKCGETVKGEVANA